jgi:serine protease
MTALGPARVRRAVPATGLIGTCLAALAVCLPGPANAADYSSNRVVVEYAAGTAPAARAAAARAADAGAPLVVASHTRVLRLAPGTTVAHALARLRRQPGVRWAVPDFRAHISDVPPVVPDDPGRGTTPGGWQQVQWNFDGPFGVNAPQAWGNLVADGAPGGRGVIVAVLDTGVAYANRGRFRRSPDFGPRQFVRGYDFVSHTPYPVDHNGHGTHVAGTIAEATGNGIGLTGLAYGARIMPVRVLDSQGEGDASTIAKGVRFAVQHHAQVINLSLEFTPDVTGSDIPELLAALRYAHHRGVVVVAAAGNEGHAAIAYPARVHNVIAVGASTEHGCLSNFSNDGPGLALVAPGGGPDASLPGDPNCHPQDPPGGDIYQYTFSGSSPSRFGIPPSYAGTSMAAPHVSAVAALVIASHVIGVHPTPAAIEARLRATTRKLGVPSDAERYGAGLLDAAAATASTPPPA